MGASHSTKATAAIGGGGTRWAGSETAKGPVCFEGASIPRWPRLPAGGTDFCRRKAARRGARRYPLGRSRLALGKGGAMTRHRASSMSWPLTEPTELGEMSIQSLTSGI